jgi:hypothetical protein
MIFGLVHIARNQSRINPWNLAIVSRVHPSRDMLDFQTVSMSFSPHLFLNAVGPLRLVVQQDLPCRWTALIEPPWQFTCHEEAPSFVV